MGELAFNKKPHTENQLFIHTLDGLGGFRVNGLHPFTFGRVLKWQNPPSSIVLVLEKDLKERPPVWRKWILEGLRT